MLFLKPYLFFIVLVFLCGCQENTPSSDNTSDTNTLLGAIETLQQPTDSCVTINDPANNPVSNDFYFTIGGEQTHVPLYTTHDFDCVQPNITRVVITVHGLNRTAESYFTSAVDIATTAENALDHTLILAPQFLADTDANPTSALYWDDINGWPEGEASTQRISSYSFMDALLLHLANKDFFPDLEVIVVVGHSAGGQFVNRYAALSDVNEGLEEVEVSFVVMNPSSYLYVSEKRCQSFDEDGCILFDDFDDSSCTSYNRYRYGLENKNDYAAQFADTTIKDNLKNRFVFYAVGDQDTDPEDTTLDTSCAAQAQGTQRYQRGLVYFQHLNEEISPLNSHQIVVPNVGHSHAQMLADEQLRCILFALNCAD